MQRSVWFVPPLLLVVVVATLASLSDAQGSQKECAGEHEFWGCQSPTRVCQRLCENKRSKPTDMHKCKLTCEQACVCEAGYLRNGTNGKCVYESDCPKDNDVDREHTPTQSSTISRTRGDRENDAHSDDFGDVTDEVRGMLPEANSNSLHSDEVQEKSSVRSDGSRSRERSQKPKTKQNDID